MSEAHPRYEIKPGVFLLMPARIFHLRPDPIRYGGSLIYSSTAQVIPFKSRLQQLKPWIPPSG